MKIEAIRDGYNVTHSDDLGTLDAQVYRPTRDRPTWALCFAVCTGRYLEKQGKYESHTTKRDAYNSIRKYLQII